MGNILSFKMRGGDEVVAEVIGVESGKKTLLEQEFSSTLPPVTEYHIRRPHILRFMQTGPGQSGLVFIPWTLSNPTIEKMVIPASEVVLTYDPSANVEKQYIEQTSGIALAPQGSRISSNK